MFLFDEIFLKLVNMSVTASWLVFAVIIARFLLKKAPKWIICCLWALVGIRLVSPFSFESVLSLVPSSETINKESFYYSSSPTINSGIDAFNTIVNPVISESLAPKAGASVNPTQILGLVFGCVWLIGVVIMAVYALISYLRIKKTIKTAIPLKENQFICDEVKTPFILGLIKPKIYLPSYMDEEKMSLVLAHEKAHLKRKDHLWKPLGFILLSVYWFNPLMWLSYILLCRDIELACDEKVIKQMKSEDKKRYSEALLSCSAPQRMITVCPVAFGEVGVKQRIKSVLNYKKPAFWVILIAVVASIVVAVCFMTDPKSKNGGQNYIEGVDEISEFFFDMKDMVFTAHTYTVYEETDSTDNYFNAKIEDAFSHAEVSSFLNFLNLGELADGVVNPMHEPQFSGAIRILTEKHDPVTVVFHDNFQKMYMYKGTENYSVRSKDYAVLNVGVARDFFKEKPYKNHSLVWEYNLASSAWGHGEINVFVDEKYEINGEVQGEGVINSITNEEKGLKGISWRPNVEESLEEYTVQIPVTRDGENDVFTLTITKVGKSGFSTYYSLRADELVIGSFPSGYEFTLGKPEIKNDISEGTSLTWVCNPMASGTWWYITTFTVPEDYEIKSVEASDGTASVEPLYYNETDGEKCVKWSPSFEKIDSMTFAALTIHTICNGEKVDYTVRIKRLGEGETGTSFSIEPLNCKITENGWAQYILEPTLTPES